MSQLMHIPRGALGAILAPAEEATWTDRVKTSWFGVDEAAEPIVTVVGNPSASASSNWFGVDETPDRSALLDWSGGIAYDSRTTVGGTSTTGGSSTVGAPTDDGGFSFSSIFGKITDIAADIAPGIVEALRPQIMAHVPPRFQKPAGGLMSIFVPQPVPPTMTSGVPAAAVQKSFLEQYGLAIGLGAALLVLAIGRR